MICDLTLDMGSQPLSPDDHIPLLQEKYSTAILEDKFATFQGINWFSPEVKPMELTGDLEIGQSLWVRFKNHQSIYKQATVSPVTYSGTCPTHMDSPCSTGCPSVPNSWRKCEVLFDNEYTAGAAYCVTNEKLTYGDFEERFRDSLEANRTIQAVNAWSQLVCQAVADPQDVLMPGFADCFTTHFYDAGSGKVNGYIALTKVIAYFERLYGQRFNNEFAVFAHPNFELDILDATSTLHNYQNTGVPTAWGNVDQLVQGGFRPMPALPGGLWGKKILIAPDMLDFYDPANPTTNNNPFLSADGSKYYVVIASKRSFFTGVTPKMDSRRFPATSNDPYECLKQIWLGFNKLLFPNEAFVLAFDAAIC